MQFIESNVMILKQSGPKDAFINKTSKCIYNDNVFSKSWKIIQNKSRLFQNITNFMHKDWFGSHHLYIRPNHIQNTTLTQEVDGCPRDGNVVAIPWSENGGK